MKHLVVIAEKEELKLVENLGYGSWPVLITGVGGLNIIEALKDVPKDTDIVNIGYAGSKDLEPGKFYGVSSVSLYHPNVNYTEKYYDLDFHYGKDDDELDEMPVPCYTSNDFVLDTEIKGCVFDMELAYIKALGFKCVVAYKYVSDNLDLQEYRAKLKENE